MSSTAKSDSEARCRDTPASQSDENKSESESRRATSTSKVKSTTASQQTIADKDVTYGSTNSAVQLNPRPEVILKGFTASLGVSSKKSTTRSKQSKQSTAASTAIKRAVLVVEAAALDEKEKIEQQLLELQQKAQQLELTTQIDKLRVEQEVLEEEEQEVDLAEEEDGAMERVQGWIETQLQVPREEPQPEEKPQLEPERGPHSGDSQLKSEPQVRQCDESPHLNPRAQEFRPRHYQQEVPVTASIYHKPLEEMIHMLQMPKTG